jgi:hypothetical protein
LAVLVIVAVFGTRKSFKALLLSSRVTVPVGHGRNGGLVNEGVIVPNGGGTQRVPELLVTSTSKMYGDP